MRHPIVGSAALARARIAARLLTLERLYAKLFKTTSDAVLITDDQQYLLVNEAAEWLLGYSRAELLRRSPMEL